MPLIPLLIAAYLLGCFNTGYYLVKILRGRDIREQASGNTGSRNVGRLLGAGGFIATFIGDAGKGALTVWLGQRLGMGTWQLYALLLMVVMGHIWPIQLKFRGGKGFATLTGGLPLIAPTLFFSGFAISLLLLALLRRTTISGLLALACTPAVMLYLDHRHGHALISLNLGIYCLLVSLILYAHRSNIRSAFSAGSTG